MTPSSQETATALALQVLRDHGLNCVIENEWIVPNGALPALRAFWHPLNGQGRLDVHVLVREGVLIEECFAGVGQDEEGLRSAVVNFSINSLHVLLAAFWGNNDPEQVATETWSIGGRVFTAHIGNFGTRSTDGMTPHIPDELFPRLAAAVCKEDLKAEFHWFRIFVGNVKGDCTYEALLDNEVWDAGLGALRSVSWQQPQGYYSVRLFAVLSAA
jgi:Family of unknown function (DUF6348)